MLIHATLLLLPIVPAYRFSLAVSPIALRAPALVFEVDQTYPRSFVSLEPRGLSPR